MKASVFLFALSLLINTYSLATERLYSYTDAVTKESSWVGQQVKFSVVLAVSESPQGSPRFSFPDVAGGLLLQASGGPVFGKEKKDDSEYKTWRYDFAFYPQRAGIHTIPPIEIRVSLPSGEDTWQQLTTSTTAFKLNSQWPKGAEGLATLISTKRFEASEKWQSVNDNPRVGDAITLTISRNADDILGLAFPPLVLAEIEAMGIYPEPPKVSDKEYRGDLTGTRIEKIVYTFNREGTVTIPGHVIPWFDLGDQKMKYVRFAARTFNVAPNPALLNKDSVDHPPKSDTSPLGRGLAIIIGALVIASLIYYYLLPAIARWRKQTENSEPAIFQELLSACRDENPSAVSNGLRKWLNRLNVPLEQFITDSNSVILLDSISLLQDKLYSTLTVKSWNSNAFSKELCRARRSFMSRRNKKSSTSPSLDQLKPLNPSYK
ncbi:MAG: hypothetical protein ACI9E1_000180 [Cryomorphaceae bacterium]